MKKILMLASCLFLIASLAISGSIAYLTDRDSAANVFVVGNVKIDLIENFDPSSTMLPGIDVTKEAKIANTGKTDAWVWMTVAVPAELEAADHADSPLHWVVDPSAMGTEGATWNGSLTEKVGTVKLPDENGIEYNVYALLYNEILAAGDETINGLSKVYLDGRIDVDPNGDMYMITNGVASESPVWNIKTDGNPIVYVSAYAIQAEGFDNVGAAYAAYNNQWGENGAEYTQSVTVDTAEELIAALAEGGTIHYTGDEFEVSQNITVTNDSEIYFPVSTKMTFTGDSKILIDDKASLALYNAEIEGDGTLFTVDGSNLTLGKGTTIKNNTSSESLIVAYGSADDKSTVILDGAVISGNTTSDALFDLATDSHLIIEEGTVISNNKLTAAKYSTETSLFNVYSATLTMNGGTIENNEINPYLIIMVSGNGKFVMNGGTIQNNTHTGGATSSIVRVGTNGTVEMNGGSIISGTGFSKPFSGGIGYESQITINGGTAN